LEAIYFTTVALPYVLGTLLNLKAKAEEKLIVL
jgi:hypothetical protein